ncbi:hypothetical protein AB1N83_009494 [Pleurotus pulmonarius]
MEPPVPTDDFIVALTFGANLHFEGAMLSTYLAVCQKRGGLTCVGAFHYISSLLRPARLRRVSNVRSDFQSITTFDGHQYSLSVPLVSCPTSGEPHVYSHRQTVLRYGRVP